MLDTRNKQKGSLTGLMAKIDIAQFVKQAKAQQLLCGLAGSLRLEDIPGLMAYKSDYLGFRGALCQGYNRVGELNKQAVIQIKNTIKNSCVE